MASRKNKVGTIVTPPGVFVEIHEKIVADFLAIHTGFNITFLVPNRQKGQKTPDIKMDGKLWEIKSPKGRSSRTIENNLRHALEQSPNIILDLRRMDGRLPTTRLISEAKRQFTLTKKIRRVLIITRTEELIDLSIITKYNNT